MSRVLIVSNRLPVTVRAAPEGLEFEASAGGLATGLAGTHAAGESLWIGWPGPLSGLDPARAAELNAGLRARRLEPVTLSAEQVTRYYEGYSNGVLWPLFHYLGDRMPLRVEGWEAYREVNQLFAERVAELWRPGDLIWVHDYQLMLVPQLLRERLPLARIGFFLHIPFPAPAVLRMLPQRELILRGLLGADLIGLHTHAYVRHFAAATLRILGLETRVDRILHGERAVHLGAFPMGVDAQTFGALGDDPAVQQRAAEIRGQAGRQLLLGIDRLDYTKGIPRRLLAYEELLATHPEHHGRVQLVQLAVPSRGEVRAYQQYRERVDALVGRIQGRFASTDWSPIRYLHRAVAREEVAALYRAADVLLVTPVRDGMNLVAKEYAATRTDEDGVLVLSEFAGAAAELDGALLVNPYDVEECARRFDDALVLPREERRRRMRLLRARVATADVHDWARRFLEQLAQGVPTNWSLRASPRADLEAARVRVRAAQHLTLLLDYDGTLVPFTPQPAAARPDGELLSLLTRLGRRAGTELHLVSGRPRAELEAWFGELPAGLHAEHGLWSRAAGERTWRRTLPDKLACHDEIAALLEDWAARTAGAFVERKSAVLAWHWRGADPERGRRQATELRQYLAELLANVPVEVVVGAHVVEVRPHGLDKGRVVTALKARAEDGRLFVALGDDRTDEDLFAALGASDLRLAVGPRPGLGELRVVDPAGARAFLAGLL